MRHTEISSETRSLSAVETPRPRLKAHNSTIFDTMDTHTLPPRRNHGLTRAQPRWTYAILRRIAENTDASRWKIQFWEHYLRRFTDASRWKTLIRQDSRSPAGTHPLTRVDHDAIISLGFLESLEFSRATPCITCCEHSWPVRCQSRKDGPPGTKPQL